MGVAGLVYGTSSNAFYNVNASLTPPSSYTLNYQYDPSNGTYLLGTTALNTYPTGLITYDRTVDGVYYNYSRLVNNSLFSIVPSGLSITMTYNRSNTSWAGGFAGSRYIPTGISIGSDNTVGTAIKFIFEFNNQTNRDYFLNFDMSSTGGTNLAFYVYKGVDEYQIDSGGSNATFHRVYIPAYTKVKLQTGSTTGAYYFDAWYLKDLGVNASYDQGYSDGENDMVLTGGLPGMIANIFDALTNIMNVNIFGDITLGGLMLFPLVITLFVFIMKMVKAGT